jgi:hypothetical protein
MEICLSHLQTIIYSQLPKKILVLLTVVFIDITQSLNTHIKFISPLTVETNHVVIPYSAKEGLHHLNR